MTLVLRHFTHRKQSYSLPQMTHQEKGTAEARAPLQDSHNPALSTQPCDTEAAAVMFRVHISHPSNTFPLRMVKSFTNTNNTQFCVSRWAFGSQKQKLRPRHHDTEEILCHTRPYSYTRGQPIGLVQMLGLRSSNALGL